MFLQKKLNITIHWIELKFRFFYYLLSFLLSFGVLFSYKVEIFYTISSIFLSYEDGFIYTGILDPLIVYIKISLFFAIIITFPVLFYFIGIFILQGFSTITIKLVSGIILFYYFFVGSFFVVWYNMLFKTLLSFFLSYQRNAVDVMELSLKATLPKYLVLFFYFVYVYLIIVLLPLLIISLIFYFNKGEILFSVDFRKYIYLSIFLIFIVVAPPDFVVQLLLLPAIILFLEVFIYLSTLFYLFYKFYFSE